MGASPQEGKTIMETGGRGNISRFFSLQDFTMAVNEGIAMGALDEWLKTTDQNGDYPIVEALAAEPVSLLERRCRAIGGEANVFVSAADGVHAMSAHIRERMPDSRDTWREGTAPISGLLDRLWSMGADGEIILRIRPAMPAVALGGHTIIRSGVIQPPAISQEHHPRT